MSVDLWFYPRSLLLFFVLIFGCCLSGCAVRPAVSDGLLVTSKHYPDFLVVTAQPGDDFATLAKRYLNDSSQGWMIAEFNGRESLSLNQELLIPLEPFRLGGLTSAGFQTVPILTYHNFSTSKPNKMTVKKTDFEQQMRFLKDHGFHVISMKDFFEFLDYKRQLPEKSVVITIDDGWKSFYTIAYPILKKYGYPATLFIYTDLIDGRGNHLSWEEIKEMSTSLISMQCHTLSHRYLNKRKSGENYLGYVKEIEKELKLSADLIESQINKKVDLLAYPYGESNHLVSAYTFKSGFRGAFTVKPKANPFFVPRYKINRTMILGEYGINRFKASLNVFTPQTLQ